MVSRLLATLELVSSWDGKNAGLSITKLGSQALILLLAVCMTSDKKLNESDH